MSWRSIGLSHGAPFVALLATAVLAEDAAEQLILQAESRRIQAMLAGDLRVLDELLSDDLTYVHTSGRLETKQEFIESLRSGQLRYRKLDRDQVRARVYGATAVVTGRAKVEVDSGGEHRAFEIRFVDVWVGKGGRWQMVAWQSTRLPET